MRRRGLLPVRIVALTGIVAVTIGLPAPVAAAQDLPGDACPDPVPADEVAPGMTGTGLTVVEGTEPEGFDVEVLGVLEEGIAPDVDMILVDVTSPAVDELGIWFGMSGSPVYVDGQLLGAVAYGLTASRSTVAGLTPAASMVELLGDGVSLSAGSDAAAEVDLTAELERRVAGGSEVTLAEAREGMRRLRLPVGMAGLSDDRLDVVGGTFERADGAGPLFRTSSVPGTETADPGDVEPGGNFAGALSYGDVTSAGFGTTTLVCDDDAVAFGHPFLFDGATTMGANLADAILIQDDAPFAGFKVANLRGRVGALTEDRLAGVAASLGDEPPMVPVTSATHYVDEDRRRDGRTDVVFADFVPDLTASHLLANLDRVFDQVGEGSSALTWTITGTRTFGDDWELRRSNQYASRTDVAFESVAEIAVQLAVVEGNEFEPVAFTGVDVDVEVTDEFRQLLIQDVLVAGEPADFVDVAPGGTIDLQVELRRWRTQDTETVELSLEVPEGVTGPGVIEVGQEPDTFDMFPTDPDVEPDPGAEPWPSEPDSFSALLAALEDAPRNNELTARLVLFPEFPGDDEFPPDDLDEPVARDAVVLDDVVDGFATIEVLVEDGLACPADDLGLPPFDDVAEEHTHAAAIACIAELGIALGTSTDPPLYRPRGAVTRGQMATFLARSLDAAGLDLPEPEDQGLTDVAGTAHAEQINQLVAAGILAGRGDDTYAPNRPVRRDQAATMLVHATEWALDVDVEPEDGPHFPDVEGAHAGNVDTAFELGLVQGRADGTYAPAAPIQRGQAATVLLGLLGVLLAAG